MVEKFCVRKNAWLKKLLGKKITERNTDPSLFTHCIEPKIAIVSINQNALAEY